MGMAKKYDDDPDRVRPPQRGNDERRIGQEKEKTNETNETNFKKYDTLKIWVFHENHAPIPFNKSKNIYSLLVLAFSKYRLKLVNMNEAQMAGNGSSKISVATFGPGDLSSNPSWFAVSKSNRKFSLQE